MFETVMGATSRVGEIQEDGTGAGFGPLRSCCGFLTPPGHLRVALR
jgi:hypothetical protein